MFNAVNDVETAAAVKNTKVYDEVRYLDLVTRKFKVHRNCYQDFIHGFTNGVASVKKDSTLQ